MDLSQISQRVAWLDDERRRDRTEMARLTQQVQDVLTQVRELGGQVHNLRMDLNAYEHLSRRVEKLEDAVGQLMTLLTTALDQGKKTTDDVHRLAQANQTTADNLTRLITELTGRLDALTRQLDAQNSQTLASRAHQQDRAIAQLTLQVEGLHKKMDAAAEFARLLESRMGAGDEAGRQALAETAQRLKDEITARERLAAEVGNLREVASGLQRSIDDMQGVQRDMEARLRAAEAAGRLLHETAGKVAQMEESLMVLSSQASHFQEIVEQRFSTDVLSMQTTVEELATAKERHEAAIQQLLTSMQETREAVRRLEVVEGAARQQTEEATIALRQTIEEYSRRQMVTMQQLLQELARIARSEPGDRLDNV